MSLGSQKGFTLSEIIVALAIVVLISGATSWLLIRSMRSSGVIWEQLSTQNEGRKVLQEVVDDLRRAEVSSIGAYPIGFATGTEIIFFANIDQDSLVERIRYWLDDTTFKKGVIKPDGNPLSYSQEDEMVVELAHDVDNNDQGNLVFEYFGEEYTGTGDSLDYPVAVTDVRMVRIQLELEKDPAESPVPLHVETMVNIRNLKSN